MASSAVRRPLPALIALLALAVLTALVWWRVLNRHSDDKHTASPTCSTSASAPPTGKTLPKPSSVTVLVLNGTYKAKKARSGIAGKVRTTLTKDGFKSPDQAADDHAKKVTGIAEIRYGAKGKDGAELLAYYFPKAKLVATAAKSATVTVSLGSKYKSVAKTSAVTKALAKDHVKLAGSTSATQKSGSCTSSGSAASS